MATRKAPRQLDAWRMQLPRKEGNPPFIPPDAPTYSCPYRRVPRPSRTTLGGAMSASRAFVILTAASLVLGACSSAAPSTGAAASAPAAATAAPAASAAPVAAPSAVASVPSAPVPASEPPAATMPDVTAVPTSVDPCQLVTAAEAGQLAGTTFGAGHDETTSGNGRLCVYGSQTLNVFTVDVGQAPDVATAKSEETAALAELQKASNVSGLKVTELPGFASGADAAVAQGGATIAGKTISVSAIYVLKGVIFFGFSDLVLGTGAPSASALEAQAKVSLGRVP